MSLTFTARYPGHCAADCEVPIRPGDHVQYVGDKALAHVTCPEPSDPLEPEREPCPGCHTVPAVNGACDCEAAS